MTAQKIALSCYRIVAVLRKIDLSQRERDCKEFVPIVIS